MKKLVLALFLISSSNIAQSADLKNLTDSVMNGWRADYESQMGSLISSSSCSGSVDLKNLTDSLMNGWRADYESQMGSLNSCILN